MYRIALAFAALVALVVAGIAQSAAGAEQSSVSADQYGGKDRFVGSGKVAFTDFPSPGETTVEKFIVIAHSGPGGEDAHGHILFQSPFLEEKKVAKVNVTCLDVDGNVATAGGEFSPPIRYLGLSIRHLNVTVRDNGSDDTATGLAFIDRERPPGFSPCDVTLPPDFDVVQGNYVVTDGTP